MAPMTPDTSPERRRYFRIQDEIILSYRAVSADQVPATQTFCEREPDIFTLAAHLEFVSAESAPLLRRIERDDSALGAYLRGLEQKIDLIARALIARDDDLCRQPAREVNLSAAGLSFASDTAFNAGDVLEMRLVLPPAMVGIHAYGRTVYCRSGRVDNRPVYFVGVDFIGLRDQDRDLLIRHVVKKQSQQLREHRQDASSIHG